MGEPRLQSIRPETTTFTVMKKSARSDTARRILRSTNVRARTIWAGHTGDGLAALDQVDDHQPDEDQAHDRVIGDAHVEELQRADGPCGRGH